MKDLFFKSIVMALLLAAIFISSVAAVPGMINYQGKVHSDGMPFNGDGFFKFAIVRGSGTTDYLWSNDGSYPPESGCSVENISEGLYDVILGQDPMPQISPAVFLEDEVYLRVWFNDGVHGFQQLEPDQKITSVGFSMKAHDANTLQGHAPSDFVMNGSVDANTLDGLDSLQFLRSDQSDSTSGSLFVTGNLGLGTTTPSQKLTVLSGTLQPLLLKRDDAGVLLSANANQGGGSFGLSQTSNNDYTIGVWSSNTAILRFENPQTGIVNSYFEGAVGIGTDNPTEKLHVVGNIKSTGILRAEYLNLGSDDSVYFDDSSDYFTFIKDGSEFAGIRCGKTNYRYTGGQAATILASDDGHLEFQHKINGSSFDWTYNGIKLMTLGTGDAHLCLHGTAQCEAGCDIAEKIISTQDVHEGDIVVIDSENPNKFKLSSSPNSTMIAGVISTRPGIVLNDTESKDIVFAGEKEVELALAGRVPCKVSIEGGIVEIGDFLTSSSTPGCAMKASPIVINGIEIYRPGTIIGKSLERFDPIDAQTGIIHILIMNK